VVLCVLVGSCGCFWGGGGGAKGVSLGGGGGFGCGFMFLLWLEVGVIWYEVWGGGGLFSGGLRGEERREAEARAPFVSFVVILWEGGGRGGGGGGFEFFGPREWGAGSSDSPGWGGGEK